jgi:TatD DNase family protein
MALGCYFSINAEMVRSDRGRALLAELPMDRLLTETDGPFTQIDGRPAEPTDTPKAIKAIAHARNLDTSVIDEIIQSNLKTLLR